MVRETIDLSSYQDEIRSRIMVEKQTQEEVHTWLVQGEGVQISKRLLRRRCHEWGITRRGAALDLAVLETISTLHHTTTMNDEGIAAELELQGFSVSSNQVKEARLACEWRRRDVTQQQQQDQRQATAQQVRKALSEGTERNYGRSLLTTALRQHHSHRARHSHIGAELKLQDPASSTARQPGQSKRKRRNEFITHGPDYVWSIDGHDKLRNWDILIYACIDGYSRRIIWIHVGLTNRAQIAVARQYLDVLTTDRWCPRLIRSDRGQEVVLLADAHLRLFREAAIERDRITDEAAAAVPLSQCFLFGPSTANQRIESFWRKLRSSQTTQWSTFFKYMEDEGFWVGDQVADRVVFLFVFIPILRHEISRYVDTHNAHRIRKQKNRPNHIHGIPNELYKTAATARDKRYGFEANQRILNDLRATTAAYNPDIYLTDLTMAWLTHQINGHTPQAAEFIVDHTPIIPRWYRELLASARSHQANPEALPRLSLARKPRAGDGLGWIPLGAAREAVDTMEEDADGGESFEGVHYDELDE